MAVISDYALLGDCQGAALVSSDGSVDWWCPPRFDAPSVFARLLGSCGGFWSIRPLGPYTTSRHYLEGTMVLRTEFHTESGVLRLTDALSLGVGERGHRIGYTSPHVLLRQVEVVAGAVDVAVEIAARPEYGLVSPTVAETPVGIEISGGADRLILAADRDLAVDGSLVTGRFTLAAGDSAVFALHHRRAADPPSVTIDGRAALRETVAAWQSWDNIHQDYQGAYRQEVRRSALVLQALTYQPTGAVIAAPTTSLPEEVGGTANWDYRFGWLRDGSFTLKALWVAACPDEAHRFFNWMAASMGSVDAEDHVPIMFGAGGERDLTEHTLEHLEGYQGSRPVRIGNDAWQQKQLDVLGEILECAWVLRDELADLSPAAAGLLRSLADRAADAWREPDAGIWEGREGERHYLTSKLLCWVALDRAIKLARTMDAQAHVPRWSQAMEQLCAAILTEGWSASGRTFTGAFGSDHLDAGVLAMATVGFLPADDDRVLATVDAIRRELEVGQDGLLQRWTGSGLEGAFIICSYVLVEALALAGQVDEAKRIFECVTAQANDLGLLSEEIDHRDGSLIGNFPQALSHIGLINAAWIIDQAESGTKP
ncbi:Glucoamylase (glucan-1,4-alpha-glucosidase), GH15 family [Micromonospora coriariae]|uniref:Glucoamylase (Glucan-1,4-alpha-glucosidase), GH15 family n=1 Tax=Micromonospora coriariae TaxID=285665 RepID=A0A1C4Y8K5_9ACTN|nr:glycoside hydrolase family 15 protein [Micromonospora coriariae]SCF17058.1 Glucoamylase (glucan-1,4-alpha-glucosidase), GH15 family [Micromonospora coriariae]